MGAEDVLAKLVYAIANPVSSHLVEKVHHWPGVGCLSNIIKDLPLTATKPRKFFDPENEDLPAKVELRLARAPGFERMKRDEYVKLVGEQIAAAEAKAAQERAEKHILLVGRKALLRQHWNGRPNTREPRRGLSPRVACRNKWARIEALQRNKAFIDQHEAARIDLVAGRNAVFPAGTWWFRVYAGVKCADTPTRTPPKCAPPVLN